MEAVCKFKYILKYAFHSNSFERIEIVEMNKFSLFLVFVCGILFAGLVSILKNSISIDQFVIKFDPTGVGILPPEADLSVMDDGYTTIAHLRLPNKKDNIIKKDSKGTDLEKRSSELEALNSLNAAIELAAAGKQARAGRLLEHAHSLAPGHHDVLLTYGEYLEKHRDVVQADHMFLKALMVSPSSSRALRNRRRTQAIVEKIDTSLLSRIDNKRNELALIPAASGALRRIKREAYFQHIYHTAAIEGNTLTLSQIRMILETGLSVGGKSVLEHNEILGIDLALKYINTTLIHRVGKITMKDVLEIHRRVLGHVDPIEAGRMRTTQVFVSDHTPPPPSKMEVLMQGFVSWLNSADSQKLHPIKYAALAHYNLVFIHPFVDGNGRTARLLMNFLLMQAGYPPVIIRKQDRLHYYEHLQTANDGDTRPFIRFVARCMEKTIDVYIWATKEHLPEIEQQQGTTPGDATDGHQGSVEKFNQISSLTDTDVNSNNDFTIDENVYEAKSLMASKWSSHDMLYPTAQQEVSEWQDEGKTEDYRYETFNRILDEGETYSNMLNTKKQNEKSDSISVRTL